MCGISGILSKPSVKEKAQSAIYSMNSNHFRRGPDDEGIWNYEEKNTCVFLGHRRLSILDLTSAGHQPMKFNNLAITYNGEIYNFQELRKELESTGYEFSTNTDTEVILKGYNAWGIEVLNRLNGMFAFALWDGEKEKLVLARDRLGIKPLYYYSDDSYFIFSSSVKALKESDVFSVKKEEKAKIGFLLFGSVPEPYTTVKSVYMLPAGHYLEVDKKGNKRFIQYYDLLEKFQKSGNQEIKKTRNQEIKKSRNQIIKETRNLLEKSVARRLISDAPLGVFLSGGLDSSAIAALTRQSLGDGGALTTLSIDFDEEEFSERQYQVMVVKRIKSNHKRMKITKKDFLDNINEAFEAMDQPTIDGTNTYFISKAAKEAGLKTVLSGLGADELFLGYLYFKKALHLRKLHKLPRWLKAVVALCFNICLNIGQLLSKGSGGVWDKLDKLNYLKGGSVLHLYLTMRGLFTPQKIAEILKINEKEVHKFINELSVNISPEAEKLDPINLLSYLELSYYTKNQLLKDTDFMSMHHSVEVRVPFLDHKLVEYIASLPVDVKLLGKSDFQKLNKPLLVAAVQDLLPRGIWDRAKMGFTFPFQKWVKETPSLVTNYKLPVTNFHWSRNWAKVVLERFG